MTFLGPKDAPVKSSFLTIISHIGPTHLQRVSPSLHESLWQTGPPYLPILTYNIFYCGLLGNPCQPFESVGLYDSAWQTQKSMNSNQ